MAVHAAHAHPNTTLQNLRDNAGQSQQDLADALNQLAAAHGRTAGITSNQISRWERGIAYPQPFYRRLLAEHHGIPLAALGMTRQRISPDEGTLLITTDDDHVGADVQHSQAQWTAVRAALNTNRVALATAAARLYPLNTRIGDTGLIAPPDWIPDQPIPLDPIHIPYDDTAPGPAVTGAEPESANARPLNAAGARYTRYSQAIRDIAHPRLFENKLSYRLTGMAGTEWTFGSTTYFDMIDVAETAAHETAAAHLTHSPQPTPPSWRGLNFRRHLGDPFDLARRALLPSIDTLTIRRDSDGATLVLHDRNPGRVAVAGGMLHVMPCGVFQPSSVLPAAQATDFDLWRNIMREYSEEFLGAVEHGGDGQPVDYTQPPFRGFDDARRAGRFRVYVLGVALDALTLWGEVLTVAVVDGDVYDQLFVDMVDANDEGVVVKTGRARPTAQLPFTAAAVDELLASGRLAPAAAGCLQLAWQHRRKILT